MSDALWEAVDELVAQAPDLEAIQFHRLGLLAAHLHRRMGLAVDPQLRIAEREHALRALAAPFVLRRIRSLVDGPLVVMKGPEVAASYAQPGCRPFKDLDILTSDVTAAQSALLRAGFTTVSGKGSTAYHARPLALPGLPLTVELHSAPHFAPGLCAPSSDVLLRLTRPSRTGVTGMAGLIPSAHAVVLAVHGWAHEPLQRLALMIDVAAVLDEGDRAAADELARSWGCRRLWHATTDCVDALFAKKRRRTPMRTWARHLARTRVPTLLSSYLARVAAPAWALPPVGAVRFSGAELLRTALPREEESWTDHVLLSRRALAAARTPLSQYHPLTTLEESCNEPAFARA